MNIQAVRQKDALIAEVRSADFWLQPSIDKLESARQELRGIIKYRQTGSTGGYAMPSTRTGDDGVEVNERKVVIAGAKAAVERAMELCKAKGAKRALPLPVSVPSHCELMRPAAERFAESIEAIDWKMPAIALVQNVSAAVAADLPTLKRDLLEQLYKPVRWVESVQALAANGPVDLVECGPGKVLVGISKRCAEGVTTHNLNTPDAFAAARLALV